MSVVTKQYTEEEIKLIKNAAKIELSRRSFFYFCNTLSAMACPVGVAAKPPIAVSFIL